MIILSVDDQPLILRSIEQKLKNKGYQLRFAKSGKDALCQYKSISPDLMIIDINMPGMDGYEVIWRIRQQSGHQCPILVMSAEDCDQSIAKAFELGADDFIQKPAGLGQLLARIQKLLQQKINITHDELHGQIMKNIVGVVIPCYNESTRLRTSAFHTFIKDHSGYHLCFVNDGSTDDTLTVLEGLASENPDFISVFNCEKNGGKAEAVRQGILHLIQDPQLDFLGYLDADLSTNFQDFIDLVDTISTSDFKIVSGSRIQRMGADISKSGSRAVISYGINWIIQRILGMSFRDTQCGAKVMTREVAENMFQSRFLTSWLFDVEIFLRMKRYYGSEAAKSYICEQPLKRWIHEDGSKLSMKDSLKIFGQLLQISRAYPN